MNLPSYDNCPLKLVSSKAVPAKVAAPDEPIEMVSVPVGPVIDHQHHPRGAAAGGVQFCRPKFRADQLVAAVVDR